MSIELLYITPLWLVSNAIRYSHDNHHLSDTLEAQQDYVISVLGMHNEKVKEHIIGSKDYDLIKRVGFKMKHESVLRHSLIVFHLEGSRGMLQEVTTHCVGVEPTRKSTRFTLKELKKEEPFTWIEGREKLYYRASKYLVFTKDKDGNIYNEENHASIKALENVRQLIANGKPNDKAKYPLPESFKFKGQYSFNIQSLMHFFKLRLAKDALWEIRDLSYDMLMALPKEWQELVLLDEIIQKNYKEYLNEKNTRQMEGEIR